MDDHVHGVKARRVEAADGDVQGEREIGQRPGRQDVADEHRLPRWQERSERGFYAALAATWLVLAGQLASQGAAYQEVRSLPHSPLAYALTQAEVILHYLRLAVWPVAQCFDDGWPIATDWRRIVPQVAVVLAAAAVTAGGVIRRRPWAVPAGAFFVTLAPTSSIMPVDAVAAEHRMYLPLAAVIALAVPAAAAGWSRLAGRGSAA